MLFPNSRGNKTAANLRLWAGCTTWQYRRHPYHWDLHAAEQQPPGANFMNFGIHLSHAFCKTLLLQLSARLCCRTWIFCWVTVQVHRDRLLGVDPLVWRFCRRSSPVKPAPLFRERATPSQLPLPPSAASAITVSVSARCAQVNAVIVKMVCWERHERVESTWIASFRNFDKKLLWLCLRVLFLRFHWFPGDVSSRLGRLCADLWLSCLREKINSCSVDGGGVKTVQAECWTEIGLDCYFEQEVYRKKRDGAVKPEFTVSECNGKKIVRENNKSSVKKAQAVFWILEKNPSSCW